ncbi:hypothetical protein BRD19_12900 [Halobacteriales archaeon SW_7_65_23]|nr:MAG: hypothetical protein BRD19_12900 [Halobacteriales archaeon SW_7_65_23]
MLNKLGIPGILGVLFLIGGVALVTWENLIIGGGIALVIAGLGLIIYGMISTLLSSLGMGGMV